MKALIAAAALLAAGCSPALASPTTAPPPGQPAAELAALRVAPDGTMRGYQRTLFGHGWTTPPGGCSTRVTVLEREGTGVQVRGHCTIVSGTWHSLYDGQTVTGRASLLDIDHIVPLAEAWRTGAASWPAARRVQLANDPTELVAVTRHSNRAKRDDPPPAYEPVAADRCDYATRWVHVKRVYNLTITTTERAALARMLGTCPH